MNLSSLDPELKLMPWDFKDETGMQAAVNSIAATILNYGLPFAKRWAPYENALDLICLYNIGKAPRGVVCWAPERGWKKVKELVASGRLEQRGLIALNDRKPF